MNALLGLLPTRRLRMASQACSQAHFLTLVYLNAPRRPRIRSLHFEGPIRSFGALWSSCHSSKPASFPYFRLCEGLLSLGQSQRHLLTHRRLSLPTCSWVMTSDSGAFVPLPNERHVYTSPSRIALTLKTPSSYPGTRPINVSSSTGIIYLTSQRVSVLLDPRAGRLDLTCVPS